MPSPTWRTAPTSDRSVSTSYCSIRCLRIEVISSGRSFTLSAPCRQLLSKSFEAAADARVDAQRPGLEDDAADQVGLDPARRLDLPAGGALDLLKDLPLLVPAELHSGRQLDLEAPLLGPGEALELLVDLLDLPRAALFGQETHEVPDELVGVAEDGVERPRLSARLELRKVQAGDGLLDEAAVIGAVQDLAGHLRRGHERQVGDLRADLPERALRLRLDLAARLVEPPLPVGLRLLLHALPLRVGDAARLRQDLLGVAARLADQRAVLLEQPPRLLACVLGLLDRLPDPLAAVVDHLLDRAERVALEDEERDQEADDRPDHQPRRDRDQRVGGKHQTRTYARIEPSRP